MRYFLVKTFMLLGFAMLAQNPQQVSFSPANGATDIEVDANLSITFDEPIELVTSFSGGATPVINIRRLSNNFWHETFTPSASTDGLTIDGNSLTINPTEDLLHSESYYIEVFWRVVQDLDGNYFDGFQGNATWVFTTVAPDETPPEASSTTPSDEGTFAPLSGAGGIVFNEDVQEASGTVALHLEDGTLVESIPTGVDDPRLGQPASFRITWDFDADFAPATNYYILVSAGAYEDLAGNDFAGIGIGELDFTSNARPEIESLSPSNSATAVSLDASIIIDLDVSVYTDGTTNLAIREYDTDDLFESFALNTIDAGFGAGSFFDGVIELNPSSALSEQTQYYILLESTGTLLSEENIEAFVGLDDKDDWTFTTEDLTAPQVVGRNPEDESTDVPVDQLFTLTFNEDLAAPTGTLTGFIRIVNGDGSVFSNIPYTTGSIDNGWLSHNGSSISFSRNNLASESSYYILVDNGTLMDVAGNSVTGLNDNTLWNFTSADAIAPLSTSTTPSDGGTFAPLSGAGGIVFNEDVQEGSGTIALYLQDGTLVESIPTGVDDPRLGQPASFRITWDFDTELAPATNYYILVSAGAYEDLAGNDFAGIGIGELDFTSNARPEIESLSPAIGATAVSIDASITLDLDVSVYTDDATNLTIREYDTDNLLESFDLNTIDAGFGTGSFSDGVIELNPSSAFSEQTQYYVLLESTGTLLSEENVEAFVGLDDKDDWTFTTENLDNEAPTVVSFNPADDAVNVPIDLGTLTMTFSEEVQAIDGTGVFRLRAVGSNTIIQEFNIGSDELTIDGNTVTLNNVNTLGAGVSYWVQNFNQNTAISDLAGNPLADWNTDTEWNFTTAAPADNEPPLVVSFNPVDGSTDVPFDGSLSVTFTEEIQPGEGFVRVRRVSDQQVFLGGRPEFEQEIFAVSGNVLTIDLTQGSGTEPFYNEESFYVEMLEGSVEDLAGNPFAGFIDQMTWNFETGPANGTTEPIITNLSPTNGAADVAVDQDLVITFDKEIEVGVSTTSFVRIRRVSDDQPYLSGRPASSDVPMTVAGNQLTIHLAQANIRAIDPATTYYVEVEDRSVQDLDGNHFVEGFGTNDPDAWSFTTEAVDNEAPVVVAFDPANGTEGVSVDISSLAITLSEAIDGEAVAGTMRIRVVGSNVIFQEFDLGSEEVVIDGSTITLTGVNQLAFDEEYWIQNFSTTIPDFAGNSLATWNTDDVWNFTTESADALRLVSLNPTVGTMGFGVDDNLIMTFNEEVQLTGAGNLRIFNRTSGSQVGPNWFFPAFATVDGAEVTVDIPVSLNPGTEYYIEITDAIEDLDGNFFPNLEGPDEWHFTTEGEAQAPVIVSLSPENGATGVDVNTDLVLLLDEEVRLTGNGVFRMFDRATDEQIGLNWAFPAGASVDGNQVTYDIPIKLPQDTEIYFEITNAIEDVWGNVLPDISGNSDWVITTGSESKTDQTITFPEISDKQYGDIFSLDATASSSLMVSYEVTTGADLVELTDGEVSIIGVGDVTIEASQSGDELFNPAERVSRSFTISKAPLTVTANNISRSFGEENPELTISYGGFVGGDDEVDLEEIPTASTTADVSSDVGEYQIVVSGGSDDNYDFVYANGMLTISKALAEITLSNLEQDVDGTAKEPTVLTNPVDLNYSITWNSGSAPTEAGSYNFTVTIDETNYQGEESGTLVLTDQVLGLNARDLSIYPNPAHDYIQVETDEYVSIEILDLHGKQLLKQNSGTTVDLVGLPVNMYLVRITNQKGWTHVVRFIKQ